MACLFAVSVMVYGGHYLAQWKPSGKERFTRDSLYRHNDLVDFSDFFVTFADLGGAKPPAGVKLDGKSFAAQLKGEKGSPREYVYVELNGKSFVRDSQYKLTNDGHLFDLKNAPFEAIAMGIDTKWNNRLSRSLHPACFSGREKPPAELLCQGCREAQAPRHLYS
jgi:hypothetical protein